MKNINILEQHSVKGGGKGTRIGVPAASAVGSGVTGSCSTIGTLAGIAAGAPFGPVIGAGMASAMSNMVSQGCANGAVKHPRNSNPSIPKNGGGYWPTQGWSGSGVRQAGSGRGSRLKLSPE
ncbi:hypothetical protein [uncultured Shewanella sp.]|uniref:hypothetical protein n=1 Tax=uncultured Shewanella sp. TaxID=173975 RepID=UPI00262EEA3E|nr:hypothetical protein [uncultured Shewanella sp.]